MYQLATLMDASGKLLDFQPRAVFCGSEKLFPYQRAKIEAVFDCRAYHWYGHSECLALGGACEYSNTLHFYPQYGYTELIPSGVTDERGRELFEIVATGFNNPAMPMIRYCTGDYAIPAEFQKCRCGRNYLLIDEVIGRQQEFIVDAKGELISATSLIFGQHYAAFGGLASIKLHQRQPGEIDVIMVKGSGFREDLMLDMETRMRELIGARMTMRFLFADETEKTAIGKARLVEQELDTREYLS
jgi:phenylacetate-CoA ligase